jgi:alpha-ketoglutarate-dependent taurine dioxygenase
MKIKNLNNCGVEILDIDISNLTDSDYQEIKKILHEHLVVVIKNQSTLSVPFAKLVHKLGRGGINSLWQAIWDRNGNKITDRSYIPQNPFEYNGPDELWPVQRVTGQRKNGSISGIFATGTLDWHCNMNSLNKCDGVALHGISEGIVGTSTSWMDTTKAFLDLPQDIRERCEKVWAHFECAPEIWAEGLQKDQWDKIMEMNPEPYRLPLVNKSRTGKKGLYFHYMNKCTIPKDPELLEILKKHCFQDKYIYKHEWEPGDVVLSDQLLTLHKRDQDDPEILKERILHRYIFYIDD